MLSSAVKYGPLALARTSVKATPPAPPFSPDSIADLGFWMDTQTPSSMTLTGSVIDSIQNIVTGAEFVAAGAASNLVTEAGIFGSRPAAKMPATARFTGVAVGVTPEFTLFIAANTAGTGGGEHYYIGPFGGFDSRIVTGGGNGWVLARGPNFVYTSTATVTADTDYVFGVRKLAPDGDPDTVIQVNGVDQSLAANQASTGGVFSHIGGAGNAEIGSFGTILIYNRALTDAEMLQVTEYLKARWGVA